MSWAPQIERVDASVAGSIAGEAEFLASEKATYKRVGATYDASAITADGNGNKILKKGTVVGRVTATGRYVPYASGNTDGSQNPVGFVPETMNLKKGNVVAGLVIGGSVIAARCTGLTAAAKTALRAFTFQ